MPREPATAEPSEWRKRQATQIPIPLSLAYALWDFCCAGGRNEDAKHLMDAIEAVLPGFFSSSEAAIPHVPILKMDLAAKDAEIERLRNALDSIKRHCGENGETGADRGARWAAEVASLVLNGVRYAE